MLSKKDRPVTLKDLARECGLSAAAVSRCLDPNPKSTIRVSVATVQRVAELAQKLGYRHNLAARSLRKGKTETIGLACFHGFLKSSPHRLLEVLAAVKRNGYQPFIHHMVDDSPVACGQLVETMLDHRVDGVLLLQPAEHFPQSEVDRLLAANVPVVSLSTSTLKRIPCYVPDKTQGFYLLAKHLLEEGYCSILLVGGELTDGEIKSLQTRSALRGCRRAIEECLDSSTGRLRVLQTRSAANLPRMPEEEHLSAVSLGGYAAAKRLVLAGQLPDALLFMNSAAAAGALRALGEAGVRVPADVAVAGFSAEAFTALGPLPITTVEHYFHEPCNAAVERLARILRGEDRIEQETILSPCRLVVRQSSVRRPCPPLLPDAPILEWLPADMLQPFEFHELPRD